MNRPPTHGSMRIDFVLVWSTTVYSFTTYHSPISAVKTSNTVAASRVTSTEARATSLLVVIAAVTRCVLRGP